MKCLSCFSLFILGWTSVSIPMYAQIAEETGIDSSVIGIESLPDTLESFQSGDRDSTIWSVDTTIVQLDTAVIVTQQDTLLEIESIPYNMPMGDISFADSIVMYDPGAMGKDTGDEPDPEFQEPDRALGAPDYETNGDTGFVSLGRGGYIILKFTDNVLMDGPGPDLRIFETNSNPEDFYLWISQDGTIFLPLGKVEGNQSDIDIQSRAELDVYYAYVRIRDDPNQGEETGPSLGADIDAVGAIHSAVQKKIYSDQLFDGKTSNLSNQAPEILGQIANTIRQYSPAAVSIEAHTDSWGDENYNLILSQQQAYVVRNYFLDREQLRDVNYTVIGWGEMLPITSNDTEYERYQNRRVEILIKLDWYDPLFNQSPYD